MKINKSTYLLVCLIEECAEVIQRACKAIRFGLTDVEPGQPLSNRERVETELVDLQAVIQLNQREDNIALFLERKYITHLTKKFIKVGRYMKYSQQKGMLDSTDLDHKE